jgi:hypothetical protein
MAAEGPVEGRVTVHGAANGSHCAPQPRSGCRDAIRSEAEHPVAA